MTIDLTPDDIQFLRELIETYPVQGTMRTLIPVQNRMRELLAKLTPAEPPKEK